MGTVTENKKTIKKFKDLNSFVLETMIDKDPEIYSAVAKVLDSIERKYFYSSQTEAKEWTLDDFKGRKIIVDSPEKSQRFQELLFSLGSKWSGFIFTSEEARREVKYTDQKYLGIRDSGTLFYFTDEEEYKTYEDQPGVEMKEIFYDDIFPSQTITKETTTKKWTVEDFADTKIVVDTPGKSQRFQELLFSLGIAWSSVDVYEESKRDTAQHTDKKYLMVRQEGTAFTGYELIYINSMVSFNKSDKKLIFYDDIFPPLTTTTEIETKQWTLDDFKGTRILVSSEEKSKRFQELIFSLGGEWVSGEKKTPILLDIKFLTVDMEGEISFRSAEDFQDSVYKQIFYNNIFPEDQDKKQKEPVSTTYTRLKDFYKTKIEVSQKQSKELQQYLFSLGGKWFTGNRDLNWFDEKYLVIDEKGILRPLTKFGFDEIYYKRIYYSDVFRTDIERAFKDETLETDFLTWPKPEIEKIYRIEKNKGDRKSPTQSAGELKDLFNDERSKTALFATYFRGNDGNWYRLYEDKNGTWRWSKQATPKQLK